PGVGDVDEVAHAVLAATGATGSARAAAGATAADRGLTGGGEGNVHLLKSGQRLVAVDLGADRVAGVEDAIAVAQPRDPDLGDVVEVAARRLATQGGELGMNLMAVWRLRQVRI